MIFYDCLTAPSPRRARIFLAEKNAEYETVLIDLSKAEQLGDAYRAINPRCTVPALKLDDDTVLTENAGIAAYLEAAYPDKPLLGATATEKGLIAAWNSSIEFDGLYPIAEALRNASPGLKDRAITGPDNHAQIPELAARGRRRVELFFDRLNEYLKDREFIITDAFSQADISAAVAVDFARIVKVKAQEHHVDLIRWRAGLAQRPSFSL
ncbi:MAG: glutathione S-transferase [Arenicella sp.]|nr:glutathione S-transferase [Arenicella sp.]